MTSTLNLKAKRALVSVAQLVLVRPTARSFVTILAVGLLLTSCVTPSNASRTRPAVYRAGDPYLEGNTALLSEYDFRQLLLVVRERLKSRPGYRVQSVRVESSTNVVAYFGKREALAYFELKRVGDTWRVIREDIVRIIVTDRSNQSLEPTAGRRDAHI
jgi:hypothetical protein